LRSACHVRPGEERRVRCDFSRSLTAVVGLTALPLITITAFFPGVCIKLPLIEARLRKKRRVRVVVLEGTR